MKQYYWQKDGPQLFTVRVTTGGNSQIVEIHTTKRAAVAHVDRLNARLLARELAK